MKAAAFEQLMDDVDLRDFQKIAMRRAIVEGVESNVVPLRNEIRLPLSDFSLTSKTTFDESHFVIASEIDVSLVNGQPVENPVIIGLMNLHKTANVVHAMR